MGIGLTGSLSGNDDSGGAAPLAEINVTPLVDVMLVLLIIFMVAAPLMTVGVPVQLPKASAPKITEPKTPIVITVDREGQTHLGKEVLDPANIVARLRGLARENPGQVVLVRGDRGVPYGRVMEAMGQIGTAGFTKVSLVAQGAPSSAMTGTE